MSTPALALDDLLDADALRVLRNAYDPGILSTMSKLVELAYLRGRTDSLRYARELFDQQGEGA